MSGRRRTDPNRGDRPSGRRPPCDAGRRPGRPHEPPSRICNPEKQLRFGLNRRVATPNIPLRQGQTADPKPNHNNSCLMQGSHRTSGAYRAIGREAATRPISAASPGPSTIFDGAPARSSPSGNFSIIGARTAALPAIERTSQILTVSAASNREGRRETGDPDMSATAFSDRMTASVTALRNFSVGPT